MAPNLIDQDESMLLCTLCLRLLNSSIQNNVMCGKLETFYLLPINIAIERKFFKLFSGFCCMKYHLLSCHTTKATKG